MNSTTCILLYISLVVRWNYGNTWSLYEQSSVSMLLYSSVETMEISDWETLRRKDSSTIRFYTTSKSLMFQNHLTQKIPGPTKYHVIFKTLNHVLNKNPFPFFHFTNRSLKDYSTKIIRAIEILIGIRFNFNSHCLCSHSFATIQS